MFRKEFFIVPEELFRLGNSTSPKLSNVRPKDVDTTEIDEIRVIIANSKDISVFDKEGIHESSMTG